MAIDLLTVTASDLQGLLVSGQLTSVDLVNTYLDQIQKHDDYLHAVISTAPRISLIEQAKRLDDERRQGQIRSKMHGIPILIKVNIIGVQRQQNVLDMVRMGRRLFINRSSEQDNIATSADLQMGTTAGSLALVGSTPKQNAKLVDRLIEAGVIIIGKSNLSELSYYKGSGTDCGWSALGGQTQSAYVIGGFRADDSYAGHSNPDGSSSGSAVGVSAGYAPCSIGTETEGSLVLPANRAALYSMKPTIPIISQSGLVPISSFCDSAGPMTKSAKDLANLLDILVDSSKTTIPSGGYISAATGKWDGLKIGALDPYIWTTSPEETRPEPGAEDQMRQEAIEAYAKLSKLMGKSFRGLVSLIPASNFVLNNVNSLTAIFAADFKTGFEKYLAQTENSKIQTLEELIQFNFNNSAQELPPRNPNQDVLQTAANPASQLSPEAYGAFVDHARLIGRTQGIDRTFQDNDINIVIGPAESDIVPFASGSGYPMATVPVGYLKFNGRPHGLAAIASAHHEALLVQFQSAWEASFPARQPPPI